MLILILLPFTWWQVETLPQSWFVLKFALFAVFSPQEQEVEETGEKDCGEEIHTSQTNGADEWVIHIL